MRLVPITAATVEAPRVAPAPTARVGPDAWMAGMSQQIGHLRLRELPMPGTHVSGSATLQAYGDLAPDIVSFADRAFHTPLWPRLIDQVSSWAITQGLSIAEQLEAGVRYFDLRVWHTRGELLLCHGLRGGPVSEAIEAIRRFTQAPGHDKEIILLDFNQFYEMTPEAHQRLARLITRHLSDVLVSRARVAMGHVRGGHFLAEKFVAWGTLAPLLPVPLREPLGGAEFQPNARGGGLAQCSLHFAVGQLPARGHAAPGRTRPPSLAADGGINQLDAVAHRQWGGGRHLHRRLDGPAGLGESDDLVADHQ